MNERETFDRLSTALLGGEPYAAAELFTPATAEHVAVYHRNRLSVLRRALEGTYPVTAGLLGENVQLFAWRYARAHPPREDSLDHYGERFPEFLAEQPEIVETQPALACFAWIDYFLHHPKAPATLELTLPTRLLEHYLAFQETGQLAAGELGEPGVFRLER